MLVNVRYWARFFAFSAPMLAPFNHSPWAVESPHDVIVPYANPLVGSLAFGSLLVLIRSVLVRSVYAGVMWYGRER